MHSRICTSFRHNTTTQTQGRRRTTQDSRASSLPPPPTMMKLVASALALLAAIPLASADPSTAEIYIQPIGSTSSPVLLAEITYDISTPDASAAVTSYEAPELPETASLARIGLYDTRTGKWTGSTSVSSVENFGKGYSPHFLLNLDTTKASGTDQEDNVATILGASLRGVRIDAGQTRDFGPQARLVLTARGKQPDLNKPVVLSPEGKKVEKEEKTFLQKFVQLSFLGARHILTAALTDLWPQILVDDRNCSFPCPRRRRRRREVEHHRDSMQFQDSHPILSSCLSI